MILAKIREYWKHWYSGYWGMVVIASLGLAILFFGGVVFTWQKKNSLTAEIEQLQAKSDSWERWQPVYQLWKSQKERFAQQTPPPITRSNVSQEDLRNLSKHLSQTATSHGMVVQALETGIHFPDEQASYLEINLTLQGPIENLPDYFREILATPFYFQLQAFTLNGKSHHPEYAFTLTFPLA
ncbi:MAG: hypothetical protein LAT55_07110 [Opitutales bacterium]|nr:hypothetical protein [Opitutales bacterium]